MSTLWKMPKGGNKENYTAPKRYQYNRSGMCMICGKPYTITDNSRMCLSCKQFINRKKTRERYRYDK